MGGLRALSQLPRGRFRGPRTGVSSPNEVVFRPVSGAWTHRGVLAAAGAGEEAGVIELLMESVNAVRPRLWWGRGRDLLAPVAYVDVDGAVAPTLGDKKEGMDRSHKGCGLTN